MTTPAGRALDAARRAWADIGRVHAALTYAPAPEED